jgi:hypothetical protein
MWRDLSNALRELRRTVGEATGSYRPDLHYMRGPGPKWHAKYDGLAAKSAPTAAPSGPTLQDIAGHRA